VSRFLPATIVDPRDMESRQHMAQASLEAGLAFTNAILGATHAMSHQVGGLLDLPHGVINGILLPHVISYNTRATPGRFRELALAIGLPVAGAPIDEVADILSDYVRRLADEVGVPRGLRDIGVSDGDIPRLALSTLEDACLTTNPRGADAVDIESLFRAAM
jgi:alcohol dehydrogenase class IV